MTYVIARAAGLAHTNPLEILIGKPVQILLVTWDLRLAVDRLRNCVEIYGADNIRLLEYSFRGGLKLIPTPIGQLVERIKARDRALAEMLSEDEATEKELTESCDIFEG